jgi:HEAT repeat protein
MRKERRNLLLAALVAVALLGGLAWLIFRNHEPPEPVYQGKRLSEGLVTGWDGPTSLEQAIHQIGTNAIPTLLRMLRAHDSKFKLKLIGLAQEQDLIEINYVNANDRNYVASAAFIILGTDASNAVPALIQIYKESFSESSQISTARALWTMGMAAKAAVPVLLHSLANTNASTAIRANAADTLAQIQAEADLVVPTLIKYLKDPEPMVQEHAASALAWFGNDARPAVPALIDLLKNPDANVKTSAAQALKAIDPQAATNAGLQ